MRSWLLKIITEPFVLFMAGGALLFYLFPGEQTGPVTHSKELREALWENHAKQLGVPELNSDEKKRVTLRLLEDELLFREAKRLGLEKNDPIIRQRLIQKMLFVAEEEGGASHPARDEDLRSFFAKNRGRWASPRKVTFEHVFFKKAPTDQEQGQIKERLASSTAKDVGDALPLAHRFQHEPLAGLDQIFGVGFGEKVWDLNPGSWHGPIPSKYGSHFVKLQNKSDQSPADFEAVSTDVREAFISDRQTKAVRSYMARLYKRFNVDLSDYPELGDSTVSGMTSASFPGDDHGGAH